MTQEHNHSRQKKGCCSRISKTHRLLAALCLTFFFFFVEMISSYILKSVAIFADAIHMIGDSGALIIAMTALRVSKKRSSKNTYGWARAQELGAMVNCILLLSLCFTILVQVIKRLLRPERIAKDVEWQYIMVGVIGLLINVLSLIILGGDHGHSHGGGGHGHGGSDHGHSHGGSDHGHSHGDSDEHNHTSQVENIRNKNDDSVEVCDADHVCADDHNNVNHGHSHDSALVEIHTSDQLIKSTKKKKRIDGGQMNIRGAFLHVLTDALGSVIVICAGFVIRKWPNESWVLYIDPCASLVMVSLILIFTIPLLRDSALILLQTAPVDIKVEDIQKRLIKQVPGVLDVHEFHVWQLSGMKIIASAHIRCQNLALYMSIAEQVKNFFHNEGIHSTTIQPEFLDSDSTGVSVTDKECILECLKDCSVNTCCGQQPAYVKQRIVRPNENQPNSTKTNRLENEVTVPMIEITAPSRSNSSIE